MKKVALLTVFVTLFQFTHAQDKLSTRTGKVTFLSETPIENIYAENTQTASIFLVKEKKIAFNILLNSFKFEKALMEEHFNEKYVESEKYPSSKFKGVISDADIDLSKPNTYKDVTIDGEMNLHGVKKDIIVKADIIVNSDQTISFTSKFKLKLEDYKIEIPSLVKEKISEDILVSVTANYN